MRTSELIVRLSPRILIRLYRHIKFNIFDGFSCKSYSQEGEDMILARIFERKKEGFYVDVGEHHPKRFSNTYLFYKKNWRGINIDAMPYSMNIFNKERPRDINLEVAISDSNKSMTYYMFNEPALNGFSEELSVQRGNTTDYKIISKKNINTLKLEDIFDKYLPYKQEIDFLSIDVESHDLMVLRSNNWDKYKPFIVLVEILNSNAGSLEITNEYKFLRSVGYEFFAKTVNTVFFRRADAR